jgi:hypothetical protein
MKTTIKEWDDLIVQVIGAVAAPVVNTVVLEVISGADPVVVTVDASVEATCGQRFWSCSRNSPAMGTN